jgi:hypothetical protein
MSASTILVDLDNIIIVNDTFDLKTFLGRKAKIEAIPHKRIVWFCNKVTSNFLVSSGVKLPPDDLKISKVTDESADHNLINYVKKRKINKLIVITNDKTLLRLLLFLNNRSKMEFLSFKGKIIDKITNKISLCFERKTDLDKFLHSYNLFKIRYF